MIVQMLQHSSFPYDVPHTLRSHDWIAANQFVFTAWNAETNLHLCEYISGRRSGLCLSSPQSAPFRRPLFLQLAVIESGLDSLYIKLKSAVRFNQGCRECRETAGARTSCPACGSSMGGRLGRTYLRPRRKLAFHCCSPLERCSSGPPMRISRPVGTSCVEIARWSLPAW